jgi:hypothetical protein
MVKAALGLLFLGNHYNRILLGSPGSYVRRCLRWIARMEEIVNRARRVTPLGF